jgi:hypothetical protein
MRHRNKTPPAFDNVAITKAPNDFVLFTVNSAPYFQRKIDFHSSSISKALRCFAENISSRFGTINLTLSAPAASMKIPPGVAARCYQSVTGNQVLIWAKIKDLTWLIQFL